MTEPNSASHSFSGLKLLIGLVIVALVMIAITQSNLHQLLQEALQWTKGLGAAGAIAFMGIYILATVLLIPGSVLTLGAGAVFGIGLGTVYVFIGALIGATCAFVIGRYVARDWVSSRIEGNDRFRAIDTAVAKAGFKVVLLTRLSPLFPFALLNYAFGITQVSLKDYILGSIGILPGTLMYVYIGSLAGSLATLGSSPATHPDTQRLQWLLRFVGFVATVFVTIYVGRVARNALVPEAEAEGIRGEE